MPNTEAKKSTVYIDEAGDLGINRGTQWFVISAVVVDKESEPSIRAKINQIRSRLNVNEVHMRNLKDFNRRAFAVNELKHEDFVFFNVIADTNKLTQNDPILNYNYMCRFLLERVSWYLRDSNRLADICLSSRGTSRDGDLIQYIKEKLIPYQEIKIEDRFVNIEAKSSAQWDLLQLADVCATSVFLAYEINTFGFRIPCFMRALSPHLYNFNGKIVKYGIKYFSNDMKPKTEEIQEKWICNK